MHLQNQARKLSNIWPKFISEARKRRTNKCTGLCTISKESIINCARVVLCSLYATTVYSRRYSKRVQWVWFTGYITIMIIRNRRQQEYEFAHFLYRYNRGRRKRNRNLCVKITIHTLESLHFDETVNTIFSTPVGIVAQKRWVEYKNEHEKGRVISMFCKERYFPLGSQKSLHVSLSRRSYTAYE